MSSSLRERALRVLEAPKFSLYCAVAAAILALPTLAIGFYSDDWTFVGRIEGKVPGPGGMFDLYRFTSLGADRLHEMGMPWWSSPHLRLDFFRPLASALFHLDHRLFGQAPLGYHVHAILWYVALAVAAGLLFRRALPGGTGALALLIFVLDDAHVQPVGWLACRHVLIAAVPAVLGLAAHLRAREEGRLRGRALAVLGIGLGLLVSEAALGAAAYLLAYELVGRPSDRPMTRLRAALPVIALCALYVVYYKWAGHGAANNDYYLEPFNSPIAFTIAAAHRAPILLGDLFAGLPTDLSSFVNPLPMIVIGSAIAIGVGALVLALRSRMTERERTSLSWLSLGALGALIAAIGGFPGSRLLLLPGLGGASVLAVLVRRGFLEATRPDSRAVRFGCGALAIINIVLAPISFTLNALATAQMARGTEEAARTAEIHPPFPRHVVVLTGSDPMASLYSGVVISATSEGSLSGWNNLSMAKRTHRLTRTGPMSLALEVTEGTLFDGGFVRVFRSKSTPFAVGDTVRLEKLGALVRVAAVRDGEPTRIEVSLTHSLDDLPIAWIAWVDGRLRTIELPAIGESRELTSSPGPTGLF